MTISNSLLCTFLLSVFVRPITYNENVFTSKTHLFKFQGRYSDNLVSYRVFVFRCFIVFTKQEIKLYGSHTIRLIIK